MCRAYVNTQLFYHNARNKSIENYLFICKFRQANPALQSRGSIEFISDGYPMVYKRSDGSQTIAVIINPSAEKAEVGGLPGKLVYTVGGKAEVAGGTVKVDGCTAAFVEI